MGTRDRKFSRLPHSVIVKAPGLLPMYYTSKELAEDLDVSTRTVKQWIENGLPYHRNSHNYIMIDGWELAEWVENQRQLGQKPKLNEDEGFCLRCRKAVRIADPAKHRQGRRLLLKGRCGQCNSVVCRGIKHG